jgi:hypothetical protein
MCFLNYCREGPALFAMLRDALVFIPIPIISAGSHTSILTAHSHLKMFQFY